MPVLDDQGRLFGRLNLIDAIVLCLVVGLVPVAYGAYRLFRTPTPVILSVTATAGTATITGRDFRPYLRVQIGTVSTKAAIESPERMYVTLPQLAPGAYDVVLFEEGLELARAPGALTVPPLPPLTPIRVTVWAALPPPLVTAYQQAGVSVKFEATNPLTQTVWCRVTVTVPARQQGTVWVTPDGQRLLIGQPLAVSDPVAVNGTILTVQP